MLRAVIGFSLCSFAVSAHALAEGDAVHGKQLFLRNGCYECHGTQGAGGGLVGPALVPDVWPVEGITAQLRQPAQRMPPYSDKVVSGADIADIHAYLQSIPASKSASQIPLLTPKR